MDDQTAPPRLPAPVREFLDGEGLDRKIGTVVLLSAADPSGWVRQAMLSPGEVLAIGETQVRLLLYATSRTTAALTQSGRGLMTLVLDEQTFKVQLATERLADDDAGERSQALFHASVAEAEIDDVGYARVLHGIEYELSDEARTLDRWRRQVELMRGSQR